MKPLIYLSPSDQDGNIYAYGDTNEAEQCRRIADACEAALLRCGFDVVNNQVDTMEDRVAESNALGAKLHVPIHTNGFNGVVAGTRIMAYDLSGEGYKASLAVFNALAPKTPGTSENVSAYPGLYEIRYAAAPTVYVEAEFHDVPKIAKWIIENVVLIGESIANGICNYFGYKYIDPADEPKTGDTLYRVQVGAYRSYENAEAQQEKLKADGYDAIIVEGSASAPAEEPVTSWWNSIKYFDREEFECHCDGKYCDGYPAEPSKILVQVADRTREHFGAPAIVSSGVRCETHNANVGGVANSKHLSGKAMDFCIVGKTAEQVLSYVEQQPEINYAYAIDSEYVHMDVN